MPPVQTCVELELRDGSKTSVCFPTRFQAESFVALIPIKQVGHAIETVSDTGTDEIIIIDTRDISSAIIWESTIGLN